MSFQGVLYAIFWSLCFNLISAAITPVAYTVRNAPGASTKDTYHAVRRAISEAALRTRDVHLKNSTSLDRSWDAAVLLKFEHEHQVSETNASSLSVTGGVEIVCTQCYIKGTATAELTIDGDFNASQAIDQTFDQVRGTVENFTETVDNFVVDWLKSTGENFQDGIDLADFAFPTFNYSFDFLDIPAIPECSLRFQFDGMELYMNINTILNLGATYTLNLYSSTTPLGISITKDLELGIIFAVDLILSVEGEIDISSGFHLKLEDGVAIDIQLFADDVSDIVFNGGQFEFLPVTIESAGVVFSAVLRVGVHAGFQLASPAIPSITVFDTTVTIPSVGGGIEVGVFANVAEFITNVTYAPEEECQLKVVQSYQLALGAAAGATIALGTNTWGPVAATSVPIWNTVLAEACAIQKTASSTPLVTATPAPERRQDLTATTITTSIIHTGVSCITPGLINCPASAQATTQYTETTTIVTSLPPGEEFTLQSSVQNTVPTTVAFGSNAISVPMTTGSPVSYVPPPPKTTDDDTQDGNEAGTLNEHGDKLDSLDGEVGGVSKKVIVGVSVGLGVPVLLALIGGVIFLMRRRKSHAISKAEAAPMIAEPYGHDEIREGYSDKPAKPVVGVSEVGRY